MTEELIQTGAYLSAIEARVLGTLIEKSFYVPYKYPCTLNFIWFACRQKDNRDPHMPWLTEQHVQETLDQFVGMGLVSTSRIRPSAAIRYEHHADKIFHLSSQQLVVVGILLLRGPLKIKEIMLVARKVYKFVSVDQIEFILNDLVARGEMDGKPVIGLLPRRQGETHKRWTETLSRPLNGPPPKPTKQEIIFQANILRSKLEHLENALGLKQELDEKYDDTITSRFDETSR